MTLCKTFFFIWQALALPELASQQRMTALAIARGKQTALFKLIYRNNLSQ